MTVFSNWKTLNEMAIGEAWDDLIKEFTKTTIVESGKCEGIMYSAKEMYRRVCGLMHKSGQKVPVEMSDKASDMFAEAWDAEALLMIKGEASKYGKLTPSALKVLSEYLNYRKKAEEIYKTHYYRNDFDVKLDDGVIVRVNSGGVSFIREGREYVVYFSER